MLAAIYFDNQIHLSASEVCKVRTDWELTDEFVSIQPSTTKFVPQRFFGIILNFAQFSGSLGLPYVLAAHSAAPHPPFGHLLPVNGEKED